MKPYTQLPGFTLVELMIVIAIIGILAAVGYPSYVSNIVDGRRSDAMGTLASFANAMERRYAGGANTYLGAATTGADTGAPDASVFASEAPLSGADKYYNLTIAAATATTYTLRATPKGGQASDGYLELLSTGQKQWDRDNNGSISGTENCWDESC